MGVDIVEVARIRSIWEKFGPRFLARIFTPEEITYCKIGENRFRYPSLAARFAAKEAFYKAVFPLVRHAIPWHHCVVVNDGDGVPALQIPEQLLQEIGGSKLHLSLSHSERYAVAVVIVD